jgi:hypothetical protein
MTMDDGEARALRGAMLRIEPGRGRRVPETTGVVHLRVQLES